MIHVECPLGDSTHHRLESLNMIHREDRLESLIARLRERTTDDLSLEAADEIERLRSSTRIEAHLIRIREILGDHITDT